MFKKLKTCFLSKGLKKINKIDGPFGLKEGLMLYKIARSLKNDSVIVEIGAFKGKSTSFIAAGIGSKNINLFSIDTWYVDPMSWYEEVAIKDNRKDIFSDFLKNTELYKDKIQPLRGYSTEARKTWPRERKIDFLWIDGDHSYEGVKTDIEDWLPLVKKNGFVCFHDYRDAAGVKKAVDELLSNEAVRFIKSRSGVFVTRLN